MYSLTTFNCVAIALFYRSDTIILIYHQLTHHCFLPHHMKLPEEWEDTMQFNFTDHTVAS